LAKYPKNGKIAEKWTIATGTTFAWESLTKANMSRFADWLCNDMAQSSARQYCAKLKAVIEQYTDEVEMPRDWRKFLTIRDDESQQTYLTESEIRRIIAYRPDTMTEAIVQQQFILGCLTGARHSDYSRFSESNVSANGHLVYVSKKTHVKAELPLSPVARNILFSEGEKYSIDPDLCTECGACADTCPNEAISLP
jgi:NAD-dependent dihydropyrimidine dehydrogenase PreA subunit